MRVAQYIFYITLPVFFYWAVACKQTGVGAGSTAMPRNYYLHQQGNDSSDGTRERPWKNISRLNALALHAGDSILLQGGQEFTGMLSIAGLRNNGTAIFISSYGKGIATINGGVAEGIRIDSSSNIQLNRLMVAGSGRKQGNTTSGIVVRHSTGIHIDSVEVKGFRHSGVQLVTSSGVKLTRVYAHDNGYAGISAGGKVYSKKDCSNIEISYCRAANNPGDPSQLKNHSGNGIVVSQCTNVRIAYCTATGNGWDMPRIGNGPVGIWAWDADSLVIEHCLSYRNRTSAGGEDGGGFDLDGGVTNALIQYCLSYENEGSGIGLFQYNYAGAWGNNTIRYNLSINDGQVSAAKAGIYIWNSSDTDLLNGCMIYNNTIWNERHAAINFSPTSATRGFVFYNNILAGNKKIITGPAISGEYANNCWWNFNSASTTLPVNDPSPVVKDPAFTHKEYVQITDAMMLSSFSGFKPGDGALFDHGLNLRQLKGIPSGGKDLMGVAAPPKGIGARF